MPFRADQEEGAGDIRTDMFFELVTADAIVADISILNANVYYELGVRHGVAPRGVFMIHGGWGKPPFDIASDRRSNTTASCSCPTRRTRRINGRTKLEAEATRLGEVLRKALEVDGQVIGSPVYKEVVGLKPVDWTDIKTARAVLLRQRSSSTGNSASNWRS